MKRLERKTETRDGRGVTGLAIASLPALSLLTLPILTLPAISQSVVPATDLGNAQTQVVIDNNQFNIRGGEALEGNLFHRFEQFSLEQGQTANFELNPSIQNVLNLVQGSEPSVIDGLLQVTGADANFYLINPQGILLGPNASLNLPASFYASTATGLGWGEAGLEQWLDVLAAPSEGSRLLQGQPAAFRFDWAQPGSVFNAGQLNLAAGDQLLLLGGQVGNIGQITVPQGDVTLAAVFGNSILRLQPESNKGFVVEPLLDGVINGSSAVSAVVAVREPVLSLPELLTQHQARFALGEAGGIAIAPDGTVRLMGTGGSGDGNVASNPFASNPIVPAGVGNGTISGSIDVSCLSLCDASASEAAGRAVIWGDDTSQFYGEILARGGRLSGDGGFVEVSGKQTLIFRGNVDTTAVNGQTGTLLLDPEDVIIRSGSGDGATDGTDSFQGLPSGEPGELTSSDIGPATIFESELEGLSGNNNITIQATNDITIEDLTDNELLFQYGTDNSIIFQADADGDGNGAFVMEDINDSLAVSAPQLSDGRLLNASRNFEIFGAEITLGNMRTQGGDINLQASNGVIQTGSLFAGSSGNAGNITINAPGDISVGGSLDARGGVGQGGAIEITTSSSGTLTLVNLFTNTGAITLAAGQDVVAEDVQATGAIVGGPVSVTANGGSIRMGGISTSGPDQAGNVTLLAAEDITLQGNVDTGADSPQGTSGSIDITSGANLAAQNLLSRGGDTTLKAVGDIQTQIIDTAGNSNAGDLTILSNGSVSTTDLNAGFGPFEGGTIDIQASESITIEGRITSNSNVADGGTINLTAPGEIQVGSITVLGGSTTGAETAVPGQGGNVNIRTNQTFRATDVGAISILSNGQLGGGNIVIRHNGINAQNPSFSIGDSSGIGDDSLNGTAGEISSGSSVLRTPSTLDEGNGELDNIQIISGFSNIEIPDVIVPISPTPSPTPTPTPVPTPDFRADANGSSALPTLGDTALADTGFADTGISDIGLADTEVSNAPGEISSPSNSSVSNLPNASPVPNASPPDPLSSDGATQESSAPEQTDAARQADASGALGADHGHAAAQAQTRQPRAPQLLSQAHAAELRLHRIEQRFTQDFQSYLDNPSPQVELETGDLEVASLAEIQQRLAQVEQTTGVKPGLIYAAFASVQQQLGELGNTSRDASKQSPSPQPWTPSCPWLTTSEEDSASSTREELTLFLVTADNVEQRLVPNSERSHVRTVAQDLLCTVRDPAEIGSDSYLAAAQQLYQWMVAPLEQAMQTQGVENLVFVPDRDLRTLPLAALHDGQDFIINRYSIGMMPSFSLTDTRLSNIQQQPMLAMGASEFQGAASPLWATPVEIDALTQDLWTGKALLDRDFTLKNLQRERQNHSFGILHLATHANFQPSDRQNSYIQLWDQKLKFTELRQLGWQDAPIELLTLSACRTAIGDDQAALGFAGFAVNAGVKSALASLWYVSDGGTLPLMLEFYSQLSHQPIKAEALRQTQLAMARGQLSLEMGQVQLSSQTLAVPATLAETLGQPDLSHPYYWSAFTVVGNPW